MSWFLLQTKSKSEHLVESELLKKNVKCYLPKITVQKKIGSDVQALFPGYLFVNLCLSTANWLKIERTRGVYRFVRFTAYPAAVDANIIESVRQKVDSLSSDQIDFFTAGDRVKVAAGPLAGLDAVFMCSRGCDRADILIKLIGESVVSVKKSDIDKQ